MAHLAALGAAEALTDNVIVTPGDVICDEAGVVRCVRRRGRAECGHALSCCRGHGTFARDGVLVASVAGVVQRLNKLVSVRPVSSR